ncbi:MAG: hypothetical protein WCK65_06645 [Rhodospirillaceae bacterium]
MTRALTAHAGEQIVGVALQVATVPMYLHYWDSATYGAWLMIWTIPVHLMQFDASFGFVSINDMTMQAGMSDREAMVRVYHTAWVGGTLFNLLLLVLTALVIVMVGPLLTTLLRPLEPQEAITALILMCVLVLVIQQQLGLACGALRTTGNYPLSVFLGSVVRVLEFAAVMIALACSGGVVAVVAAHIAARTVAMIAAVAAVRRLTPWLFPGFVAHGLRHFDSRELRRLLRPAASYLLWPIGQALNGEGFVLVAGMVCGPAAVPVFTTARTLARLSLQMTMVVRSSLLPEMSLAHGAGQLETVRMLHGCGCRAAWWTGVAATIITAALGPVIHPLWTCGQLGLDTTAFALLLGSTLLHVVWSTASGVLFAANYHQRTAVAFFLASMIGLAVATAIAGAIGVTGVALGMLVVDIIVLAVVLPQSLAFCGLGASSFMRALLRPPWFSLQFKRNGGVDV